MSNKTSYALVARLLIALAILLEAVVTTTPTLASIVIGPAMQEQSVPQPLPAPVWPELNTRIAEVADQSVEPQILPAANLPQPQITPIEPPAPKPNIVHVVSEGKLSASGEYGVNAGGIPIQLKVQGVDSGKASDAPISARVEILGSEQADLFSSVGVAFQLQLVQNAKSTKVVDSADISIGYEALRLTYGEDAMNRLVAYEGSGCRINSETGVAGCDQLIQLPASSDSLQKQLSIQLDAKAVERFSAHNKTSLSALDAWMTRLYFPLINQGSTLNPPEVPAEGDPGKGEGKPGDIKIVILGVGTGSADGDYGATPLDGLIDYQVGLYGGSASLGYDIPVPPASAGTAPQVKLSYDSGAIDGFAGNKNSQPGWIGMGWNYSVGSVTRLYKTCSASIAISCFTNANGDYMLSLNGTSSRLVRHTSGSWHMESDPRWKIQLITTTLSTHPDAQKQVWQVTTPDGTKYRFGGEVEPETSKVQASVQWLPIYEQTAATDCPVGGTGTVCNRAWRWDLDRVEDPNGNVVSYFYEQERNWFNSNGSGTIRPYIRAANLTRIEYAKRASAPGGTQPSARVVFNTAMRCTDSTSVANCASSQTYYPDVPWNLICSASSCPVANKSAGFFSQRRLHSVLTQIFEPATGSWKTAGVYDLAGSFPTPPTDQYGNASQKKLWLDSITHRPGGDFAWTAFTQIEAERYDDMAGVSITTTTDTGSGDRVGTIENNDYIRFRNVDFGSGANQALIRINTLAAVTVEVRLDSTSGTLAGQFVVPNLSNVWATYTQTVTGASGIHDLYLVFKTATTNINKVDLNWLRFLPTSALPGLPPMQFGYKFLANRRDCASGSATNCQLMARVMTVTNELGGITEFTYGQPNYCTTLPSGSGYTRLQKDCFPSAYVTSSGNSGSVLFHKYKVLNTKAWDTFSGNPMQVITYTYSTPIFAYYDDPTSTDDYWNDFRGHKIVTETLANGTKTEHRFYRGMNGDQGGYVDNITLSDGTTRPDDPQFKGREAEVRVLNATNTVLNRSTTLFTHTLIAGSGQYGSYFSAPRFVTNTEYATVNKTTQTDRVYDSYGNTIQEIHRGDLATTVDDRMIERTFIYSTTPGYIVDNIQSEKMWAGTAPGTSGNEQSMSEYAYDGGAIGATPTKGNATKMRSYLQRTPSSLFVETSTTYDGLGRVISMTDANNNSSQVGYDATYGYSRIVTNSLGHTATTIIDPRWGVPITVTDANNNAASAQYDTYGRRTKVWLPTEPTSGPASMEYVYDLISRPVNVKSRSLMQAGSSTYLEGWAYYDGLGRDLQSQRNDVLSNTRVLTSKRFNGLGQMLYASSPYSITGAAGSGFVAPTWASLMSYNEAGYDAQGRQTIAIQKSLTTGLFTTTMAYDGWVTRSYDANGNRKDSEADAFGQLAKVTEYNFIAGTGNVTYTTLYAYDLRGNLTRVTDTLGNTTVITYNLASRKTAMADPDMGGWQYGYDNNGNLTSQRDARGLWLYMEYDALNRLTRKRKDTVGTGPVLSEWVYDTLKKGLLTKSLAYTPDGTVEVQTSGYDARNRATTSQWIVPGTGGGTFRMDASFDEANHPITTRYPGGNAGQQGEIVTRAFYGVTGQLNTVASDDGTQFVSATSYNPLGQMIEQRTDSGLNGFTRQASYDPATLRTSVMRAGKNAGYADLQQLTFSYDANGNIKNVVDGVNSSQRQCYQYDWLNRLTGAFTGDASCASYSATGTGAYNHTYAYNAVGNITSNAGNSYTYGSAKPHAVTAAFGNTYDYDANGNQITRTVAGTVYGFAYDYEGRLASVSQGGTALASFIYDANGSRVKGTISGTTTIYVAGLYEWQNGATTKYYDGGAMRRTGYATNNGISYMLGDQLGSSSVIVGQNGVVQDTNYFFPYGGNRGSSAFSDLTTKRFTGQYHEKGLPGGEGLSYYNARWYDPQLGRFVSADAIVPRTSDPQAFDRYGYARNNPVTRIDPSGHADFCNPAIYSCGTSSVSYRPVDHLPWYATPAQKRRALLLPARMNPARNMTKWTVNNLVAHAKSKEVAQIRTLNEMSLVATKFGFPLVAAAYKAQAFDLWIQLVKDQAPWDYKHAMKYVHGRSYVLGSDWFEFSTIGNTHYGYVGRAAGFTASELYIGAGYAQFQDDRTTISKGRPLVGNRSSSSYWDTEDDHAAVKLGVSMYDLYGDNIDETKFTALLTSYSSAMAREAPQGTTSAQRDASLEYDGDFFNGPFSPPANDND